MIERLTLVAPGDLGRVSGGYIYDRELVAALRAAGVSARMRSVPDLHPQPTARAAAQTAQTLSATPGPLLIDGLAFGVLPEALARAVGPRTIALVHHPLCLERGLDAASRARLRASEAAALAHARGVQTTSAATARDVAALFGTPAERIFVAEPGVTPRAPVAPRGGDGRALELLSVGAVIPRKGYDLLVSALAPLRACAWRLSIVGAEDADPACAAALRAQIDRTGLGDRIAFAGLLQADALEKAYRDADLYVSAAEHEGFGMAAVDALAFGLPLVVAGGGALREAAGDGALTCAWTAPALSETLAPLLTDAAARQTAAQRARAAAATLPRWTDAAAKTIAAAQRLLGDAYSEETA